jgi:hypothetical protein
MLIPPGIGADSNAPQFSFGKACEIGIDAHGRIYVTDSVKHIIDTRGKIHVADAINDRIVRLDDMSARTGRPSDALDPGSETSAGHVESQSMTKAEYTLPS